MPGRLFFTCLLVAALITQPAGACVNTSYSRLEEQQIAGGLVHLIYGAFPHHGPAFYEAEVARCETALKTNPNAVVVRNDLAVAYLKLERYDDAIGEFARIEELSPNRYETQANLGVLYKKMENYADSVTHLEQSLAIKPEGHLGLGDYYVRMAQWLGEVKAAKARAGQDKVISQRVQILEDLETNFLGVAYADGPVAGGEIANREYMVTLLKADRTFADGLLVLGDLLYGERDFQLAYRAYWMAEQHGHPRKDVIRMRKREVIDQWGSKAQTSWRLNVESRWAIERQLKSEHRESQAWLALFESEEASQLQGDDPVDFASILTALDRDGTSRPKIVNAGLIVGFRNPGIEVYVFGALGLVLILVIFGAIRRNRRKGDSGEQGPTNPGHRSFRLS
jgi:tetratricopeptide (TPR) repeat protein